MYSQNKNNKKEQTIQYLAVKSCFTPVHSVQQTKTQPKTHNRKRGRSQKNRDRRESAEDWSYTDEVRHPFRREPTLLHVVCVRACDKARHKCTIEREISQ